MNTTKPQTTTQANTESVFAALKDHADGIAMGETSAIMLNNAVNKLRSLGVVIGALGRKPGTGCPYAEFYRDTMTAKVSPKTGKPYTPETIRNLLTTLRDAIKTGAKVTDTNKSRAKAKSTKASAKQSKPAKKTEAPKTTCDKIREQLNNALMIVRADEKPEGFDPVAVTKAIGAVLALLK